MAHLLLYPQANKASFIGLRFLTLHTEVRSQSHENGCCRYQTFQTR